MVPLSSVEDSPCDTVAKEQRTQRRYKGTSKFNNYGHYNGILIQLFATFGGAESIRHMTVLLRLVTHSSGLHP